MNKNRLYNRNHGTHFNKVRSIILNNILKRYKLNFKPNTKNEEYD